MAAHRGICMALAILSATVFLILIVCGFALLGNIVAPQQQQHNVFVDGLHIGGRVRMAAIENGMNGFDLTDREDRAKTYLRRIIALTGGARTSNYCVLVVGKTRFLVYDTSVVRLRDVTDPILEHEKTCFYLPHQDMPPEERIATLLLQLKSNPELFDGWIVKRASFKADGRVFRFRGVQ